MTNIFAQNDRQDEFPKFKQGDEMRCSYRCPFYMDGAVHSYCKKYGQIPQYDGKIPPLRVPKCVAVDNLSNNPKLTT